MKTKTTPKSRKATASPVITLTPQLLNIGHILVPTDFSEPSHNALRYARRFAEQFGAKITLLFVNEPVMYPDFAYYPLTMENDQVMKIASAKLATIGAKEIGTEHVEKILVRNGNPFHEITEAARTLKVDLIIISTHGYTGLKHALLGSTAERVVRHAPCPVLTVRDKEHEFV